MMKRKPMKPIPGWMILRLDGTPKSFFLYSRVRIFPKEERLAAVEIRERPKPSPVNPCPTCHGTGHPMKDMGPDLSPIPDCSRVCKCELPKARRVAGKLTLKQVRQHALKVGRDAEAGLRRDRAEESRRAAGKGRGK